MDELKLFLPLVGVVVGFVLSRFASNYDRWRRRRSHKAALQAEINLCEQLARRYLADPVAAPLYRLPTAAFTVAFPNLLSDGVLSRAQVECLEGFSGWVQDINRGLDNAQR